MNKEVLRNRGIIMLRKQHIPTAALLLVICLLLYHILFHPHCPCVSTTSRLQAPSEDESHDDLIAAVAGAVSTPYTRYFEEHKISPKQQNVQYSETPVSSPTVTQAKYLPGNISHRFLYSNVELAKLREKMVKIKPIKVLVWELGHEISHNRDIERGCKSLSANEMCTFTGDKNDYNMSEAVIISLLHSFSHMPQYKLPFQKWIFLENEPPPHVWGHRLMNVSDVRLNYKFDITSTANLDSNVISGRGRRICDVVPGMLRSLEEAGVNYAENKTNKVAWFVSHCDTQSKREVYVRELQKYIDVDIYGTCGTLQCGDRAHRTQCDMTLLDQRYKFYLSFENSICEDYVTEKLTRFIEVPVSTIPIVLGGADYGTMLPPYTYLNVKDFLSPRLLADQLTEINSKDDLFNLYIRRKNSLSCNHYPENMDAYGCRLCKYLHEHRSDMNRDIDVADFYGLEKRCYKPEEFLPGVQFTEEH